MRKYFPLLFVELYLCFTLFLLYFGPVDFKIHNPILFLMLMILYHLSFILGYVIFAKTYKIPNQKVKNEFSNSFFYITFFLGLIGIFILYQNLMLSTSFFPYDIINDIKNGITNPGKVYADRMATLFSTENLAGNRRILNIFSIFFMFNKLLFIPIFVYYWVALSFFKKVLVFVYCFFFISCSIASGTNSSLFLFFIFFSVSIFLVIYKKRPKMMLRLSLFCAILFLIPLGYFGYAMSQRGGGFENISNSSPLGDINVNIETPAINSFSGFYSYAFVWLNSYIVQGYYGFSLILNMDWNWTYGFGSSEFLQRQFFMLTGNDISQKTFQFRISDIWDKSAQWHSFYGQFANDFGLIGLFILMFFLGGFFSRVWLSVIYNNNFFGIALLPLFALMFIFFPANNQVFGFIDTFSYFIFVTLFWVLKGKKIKFGFDTIKIF